MRDGTIVGIDLGGTNVRAGRVSAGGLEVMARRRLVDLDSEERVLEQVFSTVDEVMDDGVTAIGCGVPTTVNQAEGIVYDAENIPSWKEVPLGNRLAQRYSVRARIDNDANVAALGELHFGAGRGYRNIVVLTLGTGFGCGVIADGRLYSGAHCGAGEIGSMPHRQHTLEYWCSSPFFRHAAGVDGEVLFERARAGDAEALGVYDAYGAELGKGVMTALFAYDPEIVILGGSIAAAFELFEAGMRRRLREYKYRRALEATVITPSTTENVAVLGAAALCLD